MLEVSINTADEMRELGKQLASQLKDGDVVVLSGSLGAGKTTFSQGVGAGLGISDAITSPTYVVCRTHRPGSKNLALVHVDAYRLSVTDDLLDLDIDSINPHVTLIEWGLDFVQKVSQSWLLVDIQRDNESPDDLPESGPRTVKVTAHGLEWLNRKLEVRL